MSILKTFHKNYVRRWILLQMAASEFYFKQPYDIKEEYPIMTGILGFALAPIYMIFVFWYAYNYRLNLYIRKSFGQKHSIMLGGNYGDNINRLDYTGDNGYKDKFHNAFGAGMVGYNFQTQIISVNLDAGFAWENSDINGKTNSDTYPFTHIRKGRNTLKT